MGRRAIFHKMVSPAVKIVKQKKHPSHTFIRHQSDQFKRVPKSWRRPRGIDSCVRRRFRGELPMVNIGYGNNKKARHLMPDGFLNFRVNNVKDLELLMMHNRKYRAEIASNVSTRKRKEIVDRALQLNIKVSNGNARMRSDEAE